MTAKGIKRVEISPEIVKAFRIEAAIRGIGEKELINQLITENLSAETKSVLGKSPIPQKSKARKPLGDKEKEKIRDLHSQGVIPADIARQLEMPPSTVYTVIKRKE
jgi:DNA invertase Pin-like site-specific DNA recombinase